MQFGMFLWFIGGFEQWQKDIVQDFLERWYNFVGFKDITVGLAKKKKIFRERYKIEI